MQALQMERKGRGREPEGFADATGWKTSGALLDEQTIDRQAMLVSESTQSLDCIACVHASYDISINIEMSTRAHVLAELRASIDLEAQSQDERPQSVIGRRRSG